MRKLRATYLPPFWLNFIIHWWKWTSWCLFHAHVEGTASNGPCGRQESAQCVLPMLELIISLEQFHFLSWLCHFTRVSVEADCSESLSICWSSHWTYFHDLMHTHPVLPHCSNGKMQVTQWGHVTHKGLWEQGNAIVLHSWLANPGGGMEHRITGRLRLGNKDVYRFPNKQSEANCFWTSKLACKWRLVGILLFASFPKDGLTFLFFFPVYLYWISLEAAVPT